MIEIPNGALSNPATCCFNPSLVAVDGRRLLFYRYTPDRRAVMTRLAFVELGADHRPLTRPVLLRLPAEGPHVVSFDDPRAIAWRDEIWLFYVQSALNEGVWSASTVVSRLGPQGQVLDQHVPNLECNRTAAVGDGPPRIDRNWSPFVWEDELYVVYQIAPLTIYRFRPGDQSWELVCREPWESGYSTFLSGGTPLLPWDEDEYIGLFHTYVKPDDETRLYSMGFYTLNPVRWRIERISTRPTLVGWSNRLRDLRNGRRRFFPFSRRGDAWRVVFPSGIALDDSDSLLVSMGWNDCRCCLERYARKDVERQLAATPSRTFGRSTVFVSG